MVDDDNIKAKLASQEEHMRNIDRDIKDIKKQCEESRKDRQNTSLELANFDRDIKDIKNKLDEHNNRFDKVDNNLDKVSNRFDELILKINLLKDDLKKDTDVRFKELENKNKVFKTRLEGLEEKDNKEKIKRYDNTVKFLLDGTKGLMGKILFSVPFLYGLYELIKNIILGLNK